MNFNPATELRHLTILLLSSLVIGWLLNAVSLVVAFALGGYIFWNLRQLFRLYDWLKNTDPTDPPNSHGLWGAVFDEIYKLQQRQLKYRARLKRVIKRFRDSTYALKDGFVMLDREGAIEWWNPAAERLLGLESPADVNQLITNLIRDPAFKDYFDSDDYTKELELPAPVNDKITLQYQIAFFGKQERLIIVRDITELKKLEQVRTDFVANMSHELRTPLTVLNGYLETLADNSDQIPPMWLRAAANMRQQTERMKLLVKDLLTLSKLETRSVDNSLHLVDMNTLLSRVQKDLKPMIEEKNQSLVLHLDSDEQLLGNREELYSLLSNLVVNASKYSPRNSHIEIKWFTNASGGCLSVKDNGVGIDSKEIPRLTERFYRVDKGRSGDSGGTGLGLAIAKHILINHDAHLDIESVPGKGSLFTCKFPPHRLSAPTQTAANS
ncbi:MAG: phosphate regulon sensor histidine kinase PhoR [Pseudomonadales bacterium]|nr:phosphate regulon sensor histidine kinase PhoR [Pseudomonadales bacterium]MCP5216033.1 phosphate regulon sensor histidine kinase PhoR [Pseudomonadales bacterium]